MANSLIDYNNNYHISGIRINIDNLYAQNHHTMLYPPYTYIMNDNTKCIYYDQEFLKKSNVNYTMQTNPIIAIPEDTIPDPTESNTMYTYSLYSFLEESIAGYMIILDICLSNNIKHVVDIGCASGIQSIIFNENGISYLGIDNCRYNDYYPYVLLNDCRDFGKSNDNNTKKKDARLCDPLFNDGKSFINTRYCYNSYPELFLNHTFNDIIYNYSFKDTALISHHCIFYVIDIAINKQVLPMSYFPHVILNIPSEIDPNDITNLLDSRSRKFYGIYDGISCYRDKYSTFLYCKKEHI